MQDMAIASNHQRMRRDRVGPFSVLVYIERIHAATVSVSNQSKVVSDMLAEMRDMSADDHSPKV